MTRKIIHGLYKPTERELKMFALFGEGKTFNDIGVQFGITRERVRQIFKLVFGKTAKDNTVRHNTLTINRYLKAKSSSDAFCHRKEMNISKYFGCSRDEVEHIYGGIFSWRDTRKRDNPVWAYVSQRHNALIRNIVWKITLPEWWQIWSESGKYALRGRGKGKYVMARYGDTGPYEKDNVYICEFGENSKDYYRYTDPEVVSQRIPKRAVKSHCIHGHPRTKENLRKGGGCKTCLRLRDKQKSKFYHYEQFALMAVS